MSAGSPYEFDPSALLGLGGDVDPAEEADLDELFMQGTPGERDVPQDPADDPAVLLGEMVSIGERYMKVEKDPPDLATMAGVLKTLRGYLAREHKQSELATKFLGKRL